MLCTLLTFTAAAAFLVGCSNASPDLTAAQALGVTGPISQAQAIAARHLSGTARSVKEENEDGAPVYEVLWTHAADGFETTFVLDEAETSVVYAFDGIAGPIETEIALPDLPAPVCETAMQQAAGAPIAETARIVDRPGPTSRPKSHATEHERITPSRPTARS